MDVSHHVIWIIAAPALVAGAASLFLYVYTNIATRLLFQISLGVGFCLAFWGFHGGIIFPPRLAFHWLPLVAILGVAASITLELTHGNRSSILVAATILSLLIAYASLTARHSGIGSFLYATTFAVGHLVLAFSAGRRATVLKVALWIWVVFAAMGICLIFSATARLGQLSGIVPCLVAPLFLLGVLRPKALSPLSLLMVAAPIFVFMILLGARTAELSLAPMVLLAATPVALHASRLPIPGFGHPVVVPLLASIPAAAAVAICWAGAPSF